jgi:hypothetical protein
MMPGMRPRLAILLATVAMVLVPSAAAHAATCSDYPNQAEAQRAADTRDADGDGIYCESLPCPCATGSSGGDNGSPAPAPRPTPKPKAEPARPRVGPPVALGRRTKTSGCHVRGPLPDPRCTPGSRFKLATPRVFCQSGYTATVRHVTEAIKERVYRSYGITSHQAGEYEIDHLVPLELGGSNSISNLFPEAAAPRPGFHEKDQLENETHDRACSGGDWRLMQRRIAADWTKLYISLIGRR